MKNTKALSYFLAGTILLLQACKSGENTNQVVDLDSLDLVSAKEFVNKLDTVGAGLPIFYNMYLSVELSSLFESSGAVFNKDILNSTDRISDYITSSKKAMNLGVYAVDISYARAFSQFEVAGRYFSAMQELSEQLGIPTDYFENTAKRFETNMTDKDSLISIANEVYYETENYLKDNERFATASLVILGGWVEAINVATHVAIESQEADIIERLVDQKYSLNNLIIMLKDHDEHEVVADFVEQLQELKTVYDKVNIEFGVDFDPESEEGKKVLAENLGQIETLRAAIQKLRNQVIE